MNEHIDIYCERTDASFWSEPVNALTNLSFIIAAYLGYRLWRRSPGKPASMLILIILAALVGIGSFLFHTFATRSTMYADIIPIILFIHYGFGLMLVRFFGARPVVALIGVIGFFWFGWIVRQSAPPGFLNGSVQYLPTLAMLIITSMIISFRDHPARRCLAIASAFFFLSVFFRSTDMESCAEFSLGTHFLWHTLNGVVMYYVMKGLMASPRK